MCAELQETLMRAEGRRGGFFKKRMTLCPAIEHMSREGYDARATGGDGSSVTFITIPPIFKKE